MYGVGGCWLQGDIREHNADEMVGVSVRAQHCSDLYLDDEEFHQFKVLDEFYLFSTEILRSLWLFQAHATCQLVANSSNKGTG